LDFLRRFSHEVQATDAWKKAEQAHIFLRNIHAIEMGLLHRHGGATPPACKKRK
jgi:hypothetical protein